MQSSGFGVFGVPRPAVAERAIVLLNLNVEEHSQESVLSGELRSADVPRDRQRMPHGHFPTFFTHDAFDAVRYHGDRAPVGANPAIAINDQSRLQADR